VTDQRLSGDDAFISLARMLVLAALGYARPSPVFAVAARRLVLFVLFGVLLARNAYCVRFFSR
jgi:hypothetical protein